MRGGRRPVRWFLAIAAFGLLAAATPPPPVVMRTVPLPTVQDMVPLGPPLERGGASIQRFRSDGEAITLGTDRSGRGAVLCVWQIFIVIRHSVAACAPDRADLRAELDRSIAATNGFIVANSPGPVTLSAVEARAHAIDDQAIAGFAKLAPAARAKACAADWATQIAARLTPVAVRGWTDDLLSVPRLPVMDPCL